MHERPVGEPPAVRGKSLAELAPLHAGLAQELAVLHDFGLSADDVIAIGSTAARAWLGLPAVTVGTQADLVTFAADPRANLGVLGQPAAVVFNSIYIR